MSDQLSVLIVDDQAMVRTGFRMILSVAEGIEVVGEACDGLAAISAVAELHPDVVLMDVQMPRMDGITATREIAADSRVVILTTFDRDDYLFDALAAGASGFLLKNAGPELLVDAVRQVGAGNGLLSPEVTTRVIAQMSISGSLHPVAPPVTDLTDRETEVLRALAAGLNNAEIAARLVVGESTVKTHVSNLLAKLGLRDRVQAVAWAYQHHLMD